MINLISLRAENQRYRFSCPPTVVVQAQVAFHTADSQI